MAKKTRTVKLDKQLNIRISSELHSRLTVLADKNGVAIGVFVRRCLREAVNAKRMNIEERIQALEKRVAELEFRQK